MVREVVDDITDTIVELTAADGWVEGDRAVVEANSDVEDWLQHMQLVVVDGDLLSKVGHRGVDTVGDALNDESVDIVDVCQPLLALLVWLDVVNGVLHELGDLFAFDFGLLEAGGDSSIVQRLYIFGWESLGLSIVERSLPLVHHLDHLSDVLFHLLDELVDFFDNLHGFVDELRDAIRGPDQGVDTRLEEVVDLVDSLL